MRDVVQENQSSLIRTPEVEQVEAGGQLLDAIAVAVEVDAEPLRDEQPVRGLVGDDEDRLTSVTPNDVGHDGQRSGQHLPSGFATLRSAIDRVSLPVGVLLGIRLLHLLPAQTFPSSVVDLAQTVVERGRQTVRSGDNGSGRDRTAQRARIDRGNRRGSETLGKTFDLNTTLRTKRDVTGSGKAIVGGQRRGAVPYQEHASDHVSSPAAA